MENILVYDVIETVNSIAEILIIALFFHRIFAAKYSSGVAYFAGYSAALAVLLVSTLNIDSPYIRIGITFVILLSIVSILYIGSYTLKFFSTVYFLLIFFISETLFAGILSVMGYGDPTELLNSNMGRILGMVGTKIFDFWLVVYSCRIYKNKVRSLPLKYWVLIILMPFLSAVILNQIFPAHSSDNNVMAGYIISVCGVLYLNFSVFNYFESYDKQIRLAALEQVMERENENYRAIADSYAEIRNIKHDLKNQVNVLNDLIKDNKYDEARKYINQLHKEVERSASVCYTGNSAVDSIINLKGDYARSHNIEFITKIKVNSVDFDAIGICRILGNALDNAVEACERTEADEKYVCIAMYQLDNKLIIEIENTSLPVLVLALFSRTLWQCICFLVVFIFLRKSAGGFHAKTHLGCCSILAAVLGVFIVFIKFVHIEEYPIVSLAAVVFSIIMILRFAPLEHENKPITEKGKIRLRKNSIVLAVIFSVSVMVLFILDFRLIMVCVSFGMLTASGSMLAAVIEKKVKEMHLGTQK